MYYIISASVQHRGGESAAISRPLSTFGLFLVLQQTFRLIVQTQHLEEHQHGSTQTSCMNTAGSVWTREDLQTSSHTDVSHPGEYLVSGTAGSVGSTVRCYWFPPQTSAEGTGLLLDTQRQTHTCPLLILHITAGAAPHGSETSYPPHHYVPYKML